MAWLNIWRNRRRTVILICAMTAGLAGVLFSAGLINGWLDEMVRGSVQTFEGHVKVLARGYRDNPVVENSMAPLPGLPDTLEGEPRVRAWAERIVVPALLSTPAHSMVVNVIGIDPEAEARVSTAREMVREGDYLSADAPGKILVGRRLADKVALRLGKKLVLMSQQLGGDLGSGAYRVAGIFESGMGGFDEGNVYLLKSDARRLLGLDERITEMVIMLHDIADSEQVAADLGRTLAGGEAEATGWRERMPMVAQYIELSHRFMLPYYAVFYLAMAFGIVNTMSMAIGERTYEIGVMLAVGMKRPRIVLLLSLEALFIALVAAACGLALGGALVGTLGHMGIDLTAFAAAMDYIGIGKVIYPYLEPHGVVGAVVAMLAVALLFSFIPAFRAARMVPVQALRKVG
jgi:ABC-type lipoprotein release transport system permease subunit